MSTEYVEQRDGGYFVQGSRISVVDDYLSEARKDFERIRQQARETDPRLYWKLNEARQSTYPRNV